MRLGKDKKEMESKALKVTMIIIQLAIIGREKIDAHIMEGTDNQAWTNK